MDFLNKFFMGPFLVRSFYALTKNWAFQGSAEIKITSCNFNFINNFFKIIDMLTLCIHAQLKYDFGSIPSERSAPFQSLVRKTNNHFFTLFF